MSSESEPVPAAVPEPGNPSPAGSKIEELSKISLTGFPASVQDQFRRLIQEMEMRRAAQEDEDGSR